MTPEERAEAIVGPRRPPGDFPWFNVLKTDIANAIRLAEAERQEAIIALSLTIPDHAEDGSSLKYTGSGVAWLITEIRNRGTS